MLIFYLSMLEDEQEKQKMTDLYESNKYTCLHVALKITHNQMMAEDAVHNAFIEVIKNKDKYFNLSSSSFRSLIVIIVKNKCIDLLRKQKHMVDTPIEDMEYELDSGEMPIDIQYILKEEYENLNNLMSQIDEVSNRILEMKYILGMSYKEIAEELNLTPKNVEMRIYRAKVKLSKLRGKEI